MKFGARFKSRKNCVRVTSDGREHWQPVPVQRLIGCLMTVMANRASALGSIAVRVPDAAKRAAENQQTGECQRNRDVSNLLTHRHDVY